MIFFKQSFKYIAVVAILTLSLNSCKLLRPSEMFITDDQYPISSFEPSKQEYEIQPFDVIALRVVSNVGESFFGTGSMDQRSVSRNQSGFEFTVEYDGLVKVPILGRINISGKTIREAEKMLEEQYGDYFVNPFVLVQVTNRKVMVFKNSGTIATTLMMPSDRFTLIEAIAQTGGLTDISKSYRIKLLRGDLTDNPKVYYWNIRNLNDLKNSNILLEANDVIYIDSRPQYVNRILREISPYLTLATTLISVYGIFFKL